MKEDICKACGAELKWIGSIMDGHLECPNCDKAEVNYAGVSVDYAKDDGVFYDDCGELMCVPDPIADKKDTLNLTGLYDLGRGSGKTHKMLLCAMETPCDQYIVVHNREMKTYCAHILIDQFGCRWVSRSRCVLQTLDGHFITVMDVKEASTPGRNCNDKVMLFDHAVTYKQWCEVQNANH